MADTRKCPHCGMENPVGRKSCSNCQTPLATDALFSPGQSPKQLDTGDLEPMLPEWLRDARAQAKQDDVSPQKEIPPMQQQQPQKPAPKAAPPPNMDFLAGLQAQADNEDDEEVPDWLASITGAGKPKEKAVEPDAPSGTTWMEPSTPAAGDSEEVPDWLAGLQSSATTGNEKDELTDFLRDTGSLKLPQTFDPSSFSQPSASDAGGSSDWFSQSDADQQSSFGDTSGSFGSSNWFDQPSNDFNAGNAQPSSFDAGGEATDWLKDMSGGSAATPAEQPQSFAFDAGGETPDWLKDMSGGSAATPAEQPQSFAFDAGGETPDWLKDMSGGSAATPAEQPQSFAFDAGSETPDWLKDMSGGSAATPAEQPQSFAFDAGGETPDWLKDMSGSAATPTEQPQSFAFDAGSDSPDWLNSLGGGSTPFADSAPAESEPFSSAGETPSWLTPEVSSAIDPFGPPQDEAPRDERAAGDGLFSEMPDWLRSAAPEATIFDETPAKPETPEPQADAAPAFEADALGGGGALFTEMPDWLSDAMESPATPAIPEPITGSDALAPNELPSWVEAMRPVEQSQGLSLAAAMASASSTPAEAQGAFAGLSGVLPAGAGFTPTSKPKIHSIKLNASEDQLRQAGILEQILAAENAPVALSSERKLGSSRALRWGVAAIMLIVAFLFAFTGTQIFSTPVGIPNELKTAVSIVQVIPPDAPVLVAFDYDPSRAGEMEAAAAPLFDHMMIINHPRFTFVATNEYGTALAERFISGPLAGRGYQSGVTYLNLGYLPGGQLGIRNFAQNPTQTIASDITSQPAWTLPPLQGVAAFNQFAAIILITDDAESARAWVEQTQELRGAMPFIVISSAQASPMIQPYYESGQVQGMVSGLYGGAIVERQYNNGSPGMARRYWDGYSVGMLIAALFVFGGGLLNLFLGMRDRAAERGE